MKTKMTTEIEIIAPMAPNFIRTTDGQTISVGDLTLSQIEVVIRLMTENFKEHARLMRLNKSKGV